MPTHSTLLLQKVTSHKQKLAVKYIRIVIGSFINSLVVQWSEYPPVTRVIRVRFPAGELSFLLFFTHLYGNKHVVCTIGDSIHI